MVSMELSLSYHVYFILRRVVVECQSRVGAYCEDGPYVSVTEAENREISTTVIVLILGYDDRKRLEFRLNRRRRHYVREGLAAQRA